MWISRAKWEELEARHKTLLETMWSQQLLLAEQQRTLARVEWRLKAMQADMQSDWADDNRRTTVLPMPGDRG